MQITLDTYSFSQETSVVLDLLATCNHEHLVVDIGAGEINSLSNSRYFLEKGWRGVLFDINPLKASEALRLTFEHKLNATYSNTPLTPDNICTFLHAHRVSADFSFLSIDIDSFDFYLLRRILSEFRPRVLIVEINERIPPWIDFELLYNSAYIGTDLTLFSSASISRASKILKCFDYVPIRLLYNNLVAVPRLVAPLSPPSASELWDDGFASTDWRQRMPWNVPFEQLWSLDPKEAVGAINQMLRSHQLSAFVSIDD